MAMRCTSTRLLRTIDPHFPTSERRHDQNLMRLVTPSGLNAMVEYHFLKQSQKTDFLEYDWSVHGSVHATSEHQQTPQSSFFWRMTPTRWRHETLSSSSANFLASMTKNIDLKDSCFAWGQYKRHCMTVLILIHVIPLLKLRVCEIRIPEPFHFRLRRLSGRKQSKVKYYCPPPLRQQKSLTSFPHCSRWIQISSRAMLPVRIGTKSGVLRTTGMNILSFEQICALETYESSLKSSGWNITPPSVQILFPYHRWTARSGYLLFSVPRNIALANECKSTNCWTILTFSG